MSLSSIPHQTLVLDVNQNNSHTYLEMKQGDKGSRYIDITLTAGGEALKCADIATEAWLSASNGGKLLQYKQFEINSDNTITVLIDNNALSLPGYLECEVSLYDDSKNRVTSATFNIRVGRSASGNGNSHLVNPSLGSVFPEHLDRSYLEYTQFSNTISNLSNLKDFLGSNINLLNNNGVIRVIFAGEITGLGGYYDIRKAEAKNCFVAANTNNPIAYTYSINLSNNTVEHLTPGNAIEDGSLTPQKFDREYWEYDYLGTYTTESQLVSYDFHTKKLYVFSTAGSLAEKIGQGNCFGYYLPNGYLFFVNTGTGVWWRWTEKESFIPSENNGIGGISKTEINDNGELVITFSDNSEQNLGKVVGANGKDGTSGVYVGSGDMPDGYNVQIDPDGEVVDLSEYATKKYVNEVISAYDNSLLEILGGNENVS